MSTLEVTQMTTLVLSRHTLFLPASLTVAWAPQCECAFTEWPGPSFPSAASLYTSESHHPPITVALAWPSVSSFYPWWFWNPAYLFISFASLGPLPGLLEAKRKENRFRTKSLDFRISYTWLSLTVWTWVSFFSLCLSGSICKMEIKSPQASFTH